MSHPSLPAAVSYFLDGVSGKDLASLDRGLALSVVGLTVGGRYPGADGIRSLLATSPAFTAGSEWRVVYAMDSEFVLRSDAGDEVQLVLDCGRIALVRVRETSHEAVLAA
ncbi:MAG TPA: hypothetical protein VGM94_09140 [Galbitalea sp.]|jgi:hypothetical protein